MSAALDQLLSTPAPEAGDVTLLEGVLVVRSEGRYARIDGVAALMGPLVGADGLVDGASILVAISQNGRPWVNGGNAAGMGVLLYASGAWPTRPPSSSPIMWIGPIAPPSGDGGAIVGLDLWLKL
jgi:hypothetical protein